MKTVDGGRKLDLSAQGEASGETFETATAKDLSHRSPRELELSYKLLVAVLGVLSQENSVRDLIKVIAQGVQADSAYMAFLEDNTLYQIEFFSQQEDKHLGLSLDFDASKLPRRPLWYRKNHQSFIGGLHWQEAVFVPLIEDEKLQGFFECGLNEESATRGTSWSSYQINQLVMVLSKVKPVFLSARKHEVDKELIRKKNLELHRLELAHQLLLEDTQDIMVSFLPSGLLTFLNQTGRSMLGVPEDHQFDPSQDLSLNFPIRNPPLDFILDSLRKRPNIHDLEVILGDNERTPVYGLAAFSCDYAPDGSIAKIHGVIKDITERVEAQRQLWLINLELSETNDKLKNSQMLMVQSEKMASIGQLAAGVAHEINNPLGFVSSNFRLIQKRMGSLVEYIRYLQESQDSEDPAYKEKTRKFDVNLEELEEMLKESQDGFNRIQTIVQSLKDFSRRDDGGKIVSMDINRALDNTLVVARNSIKYIAELRKDYGDIPTVECFGDQINQVFLNIIVNAAQALEDYDAKRPNKDEKAYISLKTRCKNDLVFIDIEDNGPGIPEKIRNRIFEPFFTTKEIGKGTGLGLSISYDVIVNKHQGKLDVHTRPEGGTRFTIVLPLSHLEPEDALNAEEIHS